MKTEIINNKKIKVYDNGGRTIDRYTAVYLFEKESDKMYAGRGMCSNPTTPQGIGCYITVRPGSHLGKRIKFEQLPEGCKQLILSDLKWITKRYKMHYKLTDKILKTNKMLIKLTNKHGHINVQIKNDNLKNYQTNIHDKLTKFEKKVVLIKILTMIDSLEYDKKVLKYKIINLNYAQIFGSPWV